MQKKQIVFLESEIDKLKNLLIIKNNELDVNISGNRTFKNIQE